MHLSFIGIKLPHSIHFFLFNSIFYLFICINIPPPIYKNIRHDIKLNTVYSLHTAMYTYLYPFYSPHASNIYYYIILIISIASKLYPREHAHKKRPPYQAVFSTALNSIFVFVPFDSSSILCNFYVTSSYLQSHFTQGQN